MTVVKLADSAGTQHVIASTCYAVCNTEDTTSAKVAIIQENQEFTLTSGVTVHVKFTYANTATNPTLDINNTGAKSIYKYGAALTNFWNAGAVISFTYDGTYWQMNDVGIDINDTTTSLTETWSSEKILDSWNDDAISIEKTPIASFTAHQGGIPIPEILAYIQATQAGTGDPSPSNIRPITGRSGVNIFHNEIPMTNWYAIRQVVRAGLAPTFYPVGTEFTVHKIVGSDTLDLTFRVVDHDKLMPTGLNHSMVLESKYVYSTKNGTVKYVVFDAPEAMFYCEEALPAGTYNFTWNYATGSMVNDTYEFTITEGIPAGGQIVLGTNSSSTAITSCKISTYAAPGDTTAIESNIAVSVGSGGTALGTISATASSDENLNCAQRIMWGSNNYAQSGIRQWLNSDKAAGSVWKATNKFDRPTSWATSSDIYYAGFINGLDEDFANSVVPAKIPCRTNSVFEVNSLDGTEFSLDHTYQLEGKFFILSRPEVYGSWDSSSIKDGEVLDFYEDAENADRIKRDVGGTARWAWLRSLSPSTASYVRMVNGDGSLSGGVASGNNSVAPACIIG